MKVKKAVIPAAGLGTRMLPATKTIPKEMLPVVDKPAIQYLIEEAVASGVEDILIVTNRSKSAMDDYFDYHPELEERLTRAGRLDDVAVVRAPAEMANIFYVRQKITRGLGHAIWTAKRFAGDEPFAVLLGDDLMCAQKPVTLQLIEQAERYHASAVGAQRVSFEALEKYCSLQVSPVDEHVFNVHKLIEKPKPEQFLSNFAILGRYVLSADIFDILEDLPPGHGGEVQLTDAINILCQRQSVIAVEFEGRRYDTGNLCGYLETIVDYALEHKDSGAWMKQFIVDKAKELQ